MCVCVCTVQLSTVHEITYPHWPNKLCKIGRWSWDNSIPTGAGSIQCRGSCNVTGSEVSQHGIRCNVTGSDVSQHGKKCLHYHGTINSPESHSLEVPWTWCHPGKVKWSTTQNPRLSYCILQKEKQTGYLLVTITLLAIAMYAVCLACSHPLTDGMQISGPVHTEQSHVICGGVEQIGCLSCLHHNAHNS